MCYEVPAYHTYEDCRLNTQFNSGDQHVNGSSSDGNSFPAQSWAHGNGIPGGYPSTPVPSQPAPLPPRSAVEPHRIKHIKVFQCYRALNRQVRTDVVNGSHVCSDRTSETMPNDPRLVSFQQSMSVYIGECPVCIDMSSAERKALNQVVVVCFTPRAVTCYNRRLAVDDTNW